MTDTSISSQETPRATHCRWYIVAAATVMSVLLYLDRFAISFAQTFIAEDLKLSPADTGWLVSAFFWSYALGQIPSGWLSDRLGGRVMLTIYILLWSVFTFMVGWSKGLWFLLAMQLGNGLGQAGAYPTSAGLLSRWMPIGSRGIASSLVTFGGRLGGFLAPLLTAWMIVISCPVEKSSLLTERQVEHQQLDQFSKRLVTTISDFNTSNDPQKELVRTIWTNLPRDTQDLLSRRVEEERSRSTKTSVADKAPSPDLTRDLSSADSKVLVRGLNQLLPRPSLVTAQSVVGLKLANEAQSLMLRRDQGASLTLPQTQRLNRLVLEPCFPSSLTKCMCRAGVRCSPYMEFWESLSLAHSGLSREIARRIIRGAIHAKWKSFRLAEVLHRHHQLRSRRSTGGDFCAVPGCGCLRCLNSERTLDGCLSWLSCLTTWTRCITWKSCSVAFFPVYPVWQVWWEFCAEAI